MKGAKIDILYNAISDLCIALIFCIYKDFDLFFYQLFLLIFCARFIKDLSFSTFLTAAKSKEDLKVDFSYLNILYSRLKPSILVLFIMLAMQLVFGTMNGQSIKFEEIEKLTLMFFVLALMISALARCFLRNNYIYSYLMHRIFCRVIGVSLLFVLLSHNYYVLFIWLGCFFGMFFFLKILENKYGDQQGMTQSIRRFSREKGVEWFW